MASDYQPPSAPIVGSGSGSGSVPAYSGAPTGGFFGQAQQRAQTMRYNCGGEKIWVFL